MVAEIQARRCGYTVVEGDDFKRYQKRRAR
jgi:hypothetical protein